MSVEISCEAKRDYLLVKAIGEWTAASGKQLIDTAQEQASQRGFKRILFDVRHFSLPDNEMTRFYAGEYLAEAFRGRFRAAAVGGRPEMVNKFSETVAQNRGAIFRAFIELEDALDWLLDRK